MARSISSTAVEERRLVFQIGEQQLEIDARHVLEIVTVPYVTRVPHGPDALIGIANIRGKPVPVLSMSGLLLGRRSYPREGKIIVYDHGEVVGLLVDDVLRLSSDATPPVLTGLGDLLERAFHVKNSKPVDRSSRTGLQDNHVAVTKLNAFLTFWVAGQLFGLKLTQVREVANLPKGVRLASGSAVLGLANLRDSVVTLVSLAALFGLDVVQSGHISPRMVVIEDNGDLVGLVVDGIDLIRRLPESAIDAVPAVLQGGHGNAQIDAIGRVAEGGLLISILSAEKLFDHQVVSQAIHNNEGAKPMDTSPVIEEKVEQLLIFQLGEESYGLPIATVDEVVRIPSDITRMPGAPAFVMGVINLRGKVVPLIDQRTRFETRISPLTAKVRAIIVTLGSLQAGFVVDEVSEVKGVAASSLSAAPMFSSDETAVFDRIAHLAADGRMILLVDPQALLTLAERDIVAAIAGDETPAADL